MSLVASTYPVVEPMVRRASVLDNLKKHIVTLNVISLAMVGVLMLASIIQVNASTTKGYEIRELETLRAELSLQNQQLEVAAREAQSLEHVSRSVKMLGFVEAEMPNYISGAQPTFAMAE